MMDIGRGRRPDNLRRTLPRAKIEGIYNPSFWSAGSIEGRSGRRRVNGRRMGLRMVREGPGQAGQTNASGPRQYDMCTVMCNVSHIARRETRRDGIRIVDRVHAPHAKRDPGSGKFVGKVVSRCCPRRFIQFRIGMARDDADFRTDPFVWQSLIPTLNYGVLYV